MINKRIPLETLSENIIPHRTSDHSTFN